MENIEIEFDSKFEFKDYEDYNLAEDAQLDKYQLDIEAERQPALYNKWSELLVQAQALVSKLKEKENNKEAELTLYAKKNGIPGVDKLTDKVVASWVSVHKEYSVISSERRKAENNVMYLQNALKVLEHKRSMIKVETDLWITGYYAKPFVPSETKAKLEENRRQVHAQQLQKSLKKRHLRQQED
jgi:hypothetical protein